MWSMDMRVIWCLFRSGVWCKLGTCGREVNHSIPDSADHNYVLFIMMFVSWNSDDTMLLRCYYIKIWCLFHKAYDMRVIWCWFRKIECWFLGRLWSRLLDELICIEYLIVLLMWCLFIEKVNMRVIWCLYREVVW